MSDKEMTEEQKNHRKFAVDLFNLTWDFLDKKERSKEEIDQMIHAAHASRYHWGRVGTPVHFERGEWQISRVYAVLERAEPALFHAQRCLTICQENDIGDFDIAFAYEAMARAYAIARKTDEKNKYLELAKTAGEKINKQEDKDYFLSELKTIK